MPHQLSVSFYVSFFENPVEATAFGKVQGCLQVVKKMFSHSVDAIPKPNISWHKGTVVTERQTCSGEELEARERGCCNCNLSCKHHPVLAVAAWFPVTSFPALWGHFDLLASSDVSILRAILS